MSLFRDTTAREALQSRNPSGPSKRPSLDTLRHTSTESTSRDPTYYDVLKCTNEFSTPSPFFSRPLKPAHSSDRAFPWATRTADISNGVGHERVGNKHRLRRSMPSDAVGSQSQDASSVAPSSSVFPVYSESELPPSVFRLPGARGDGSREPWALSGMTSGGRALRKANQAPLSMFDRKVTLV